MNIKKLRHVYRGYFCFVLYDLHFISKIKKVKSILKMVERLDYKFSKRSVVCYCRQVSTGLQIATKYT